MTNISTLGLGTSERKLRNSTVKVSIKDVSVLASPAGPAVLSSMAMIMWPAPMIYAANLRGTAPKTPKILEAYGLSTIAHLQTTVAGVVLVIRDPNEIETIIRAADEWAAIGIKPTLLLCPVDGMPVVKDDIRFGFRTVLNRRTSTKPSDLYIPEPEGMDGDWYYPTEDLIKFVRQTAAVECDMHVQPPEEFGQLYAIEIAACRQRMIDAGHAVASDASVFKLESGTHAAIAERLGITNPITMAG